MKKTISVILLSSIIATTIVSAPFNSFAAEPLEETKPKPEKTPEEIAKEKAEKKKQEGKVLGMDIGAEKGAIRGKKDAIQGEVFDWERRYNEEKVIIPPYNGSDSNKYLEGFTEGFKEGFENGYGNAYMEVIRGRIDVEIGYATETGEKDAISDFYNNLPIDDKRHLLKKQEVIDRFKLNHESEEFQEYFFVEYLIEYKRAYSEKYRILRKENFDIDRRGYEAGELIGTKMGEAVGKMAFVTPNAKNDWEQALKSFEKQKSLDSRYFLDREPVEYKESFKIGFREAFRKAYNEAYQKANTDIATNNINFVNVSMLPEELKFIPSDGVGKAGGTLKIPGATVYKETHMGVSMERDSFNYKNNKYTPATHIYNVAVANSEESVKLNKALQLDLVYLGVQRAGIYQLIGDNWRYQYTTVTEGNLHTEIPEGMFKGGRYAIFIDEDYVPILDIRKSWAQKELYTFLRRDYIKGDKQQNYYPNSKMNRGEFLNLLGKALDWNYDHVEGEESKFSDAYKFGDYLNSINYAASLGFIGGHEDGTFRAEDPITYNQIEWILRKVLQDDKFSWETYAKKMKTEKYTISDSVRGKNRPISKGEVVFMLYEIQNKLI